MHVLIFGTLASGVCGVVGARVAQATSAGAVAAHTASDAGTAAPAAGDLSFSPMLGLPAGDVGLIGSASSESAGETWAQGEVGSVPATVDGQTISNQQVLLRYTDAQGDWQIVPLDNSAGNQISFQWAASRVTPQGGLALIGEPASATGTSQQTLVTRGPGGAFAAASAPPSTVLQAGEQLYSTAGSNNPLLATIEDGSGVASFVVPYQSSSATAAPGVLRYESGTWTREPVCTSYTPGTGGTAGTCAAVPAGYTPLALAAASGSSAWLLASTIAQPLELFQRTTESDGTIAWVAVKPSSFLVNSSATKPSGESVQALGTGSTMLTATSQGVWVDASLSGTSSGSATALISADSGNAVLGTWCYPQSACGSGDGSLGAALPRYYSSVAWAGGSDSDLGQRVITSGSALLVLTSGSQSFQYTEGTGDEGGGGGSAAGPGGETLAPGNGSSYAGGVAFSSPTSGWLGGTSQAVPASGGDGGPQVVQVSSSGASDQLSSWSVPFGDPILAVTTAPSGTAGASDTRALAAGVGGELAWYQPGGGWQPDYLYNGSGVRQTPTLRGVAWPETGRAYAVGDNGAMWLWQSTTDLWEPDPAAPVGEDANFNAIAFEPGDPDIGYAVGSGGTLLSFGKSWTQATLPSSVEDATFTSVTFAGSEAIVGYEQPVPDGGGTLEGGLLVNDGSGWRIDQDAQQLLSSLPSANSAIFKVAGLPGGGAVAAGQGVVIERDSLSGDWHFSSSPLPENGLPAALSAFRDSSGRTEALISIDTESSPSSQLWLGIDNPPSNPTLGSASVDVAANPLPASGYLLRQSGNGWQDLERSDYPSEGLGMLPIQPDAVLALDSSSDGSSGWALGGQTGTFVETAGGTYAQAEAQTASANWLGSGNAAPQSTKAPITIPSGEATFAVGGNATCLGDCADDANIGIGADVWTTTALQHASEIQGLRAFLWTGDRVDDPLASSAELTRELDRYGDLLHSGGSSLPVYATLSSGEVTAGATASQFASALGSAAPVGQVLPASGKPLPGTSTVVPSLAPTTGTAAYAFQSQGVEGTVDVIVLDYSHSTLDGAGTESGTESTTGCPAAASATNANQLDWLCDQLQVAKSAGDPAIVLGSQDVATGQTECDSSHPVCDATDAADVARVLVTAGASAYLFDSQGENVSETVSYGGQSIPTYGSGTLGYVDPPMTTVEANEYRGAAGYLLVSVDIAKRDASTNVAPVTATLTPNIGSLGLDATGGTLLRRSQVALFDALARLPLAGVYAESTGSGVVASAPESYVPIPETCTGTLCGEFISPSYTFTSSNPDIGDFVERNPNSTSATAVYLKDDKPVQDSHSGLFCAYNAGTTTVTVTTGGLSYSEQITIQPGSVEQPCGTVPLTNPPTLAPQFVAGTPAGNGHPHLVSSGTPVAPPSPPSSSPAAVSVPHPAPSPVVSSPSPALPALPFTFYDVPLIVPPTAPSNLRPTPPSGTAQVQEQSPASQNIELLEHEREKENVTQSVHHMVAYDPDGQNGIPIWPLALIPALALAAAGVRRTPRCREQQLLQERRATVRICDNQIRDNGHRWAGR